MEPTLATMVELADAEGEDDGVGLVAGFDDLDDCDDIGRLVVVDEFLEDGGLTVVDEEELLEMAPPLPAPDWELVVLLGMVPVLEPSILSPVDIGGELALINTD